MVGGNGGRCFGDAFIVRVVDDGGDERGDAAYEDVPRELVGTRLVLRMVGGGGGEVGGETGEVGGGGKGQGEEDEKEERKTERETGVEGEDEGSGNEPWSLFKNVLEKVGGWVRMGEEVTRGVEAALGGR